LKSLSCFVAFIPLHNSCLEGSVPCHKQRPNWVSSAVWENAEVVCCWITATTSANKEFSRCSASGMCLRYNLTLPLFLSSLWFFLFSCSPHYSDNGGGIGMVVAIVCLLAMDIATDFQEWMLSCAFEQPITSQFLKC